MVKVFGILKGNNELLLALLCGLCILAGWVLHLVGQDAVSVGFYVAAYLLGGYYKAREGFEKTIKNRDLNVDALMMIAALGAAIIGYWEDGAMLIFIFSLSGAMEAYTFNKSHKEITALMSLQPETALRISNGKEETVHVSELHIDDVILIKPGERIAADGCICLGETNVDESAITGESIPAEKRVGDDVYASTVNMRGSIQVRITNHASQSLFQRIIHLVQSAQSEKSPSQLFLERFEGPYAKTVLAVAASVVLLGYFALGWGLQMSVFRALVLLVVASPCALVASITPATLSAISNGARSGILFKGGVQMERLAALKAAAFDKTGTLTAGKPKVTDIVVREGLSEAELLLATASIEAHSTHPLANSIIEYAKNKHGIEPVDPEGIENVVGYGVIGSFGGKTYRIGKAEFMQKDTTASMNSAAMRLQAEGKTLVYIADNEDVLGLIALKDNLRPDTLKAISSLRELGIESIMITGDNEQTAKSIASESGIGQYYASCLPENKVEVIKEMKNRFGVIAMIGDGINDAPALATADIGIAMGKGTDVALETSDVVLMNDNLAALSKAVSLSRRLKKITRQNIAFALCVITFLSIANFVTTLPIPIAVIGHEGSTILVILNGLRLLRNPS